MLLVILAIMIALRVRYGGGDPYPDISTTPLLEETALEEVFAYPEPIGNVAVSHDGRVFFTVHPESRPQGNRLLEIVADAAVPFPSGASQLTLFNSVLGLVIDERNILWSIDHGNHGFNEARLLAFDLATEHRIEECLLRGAARKRNCRVGDDFEQPVSLRTRFGMHGEKNPTIMTDRHIADRLGIGKHLFQ